MCRVKNKTDEASLQGAPFFPPHPNQMHMNPNPHNSAMGQMNPNMGPNMNHPQNSGMGMPNMPHPQNSGMGQMPHMPQNSGMGHPQNSGMGQMNPNMTPTNISQQGVPMNRQISGGGQAPMFHNSATGRPLQLGILSTIFFSQFGSSQTICSCFHHLNQISWMRKN